MIFLWYEEGRQDTEKCTLVCSVAESRHRRLVEGMFF
jgi:hypothetical protein